MAKLTRFLVFLPLYIRIVWGFVLTFCLIGIIMHKPAAIYVAISAIMAWCVLRVLAEAYESFHVLRLLKDMKLPPPTDDTPPADHE